MTSAVFDAISSDKEVVVASDKTSATKLPDEVIEQILYACSPETFGSLTLLARAWHRVSDKAPLYAYHLERCPSFASKQQSTRESLAGQSLDSLKKLFVLEAKRYLFPAFTRPRQTTVNLVSTITSSAGSFPNGEAFEFVFAPEGRWCLALSSARIILIETTDAIAVRRELKVLRKPLAAALLADGSRLAVLATDHTVNIYDLIRSQLPKLHRTIDLDSPARAIALSRQGEVLAAATSAGIEVFSLAPDSTATSRRAVKCEPLDSLSFSDDASMLLGTTQTPIGPNTVILTAPFFAEAGEQDVSSAEFVSHMWTSQILFPSSSRDCSHATLLPDAQDDDAPWTLAYDCAYESFRAVRTDDLRNGTTYFTGPKPKTERERLQSKSSLPPCTIPSTTREGHLVAAGFLASEIWLYGVPEDLDRPVPKKRPSGRRSRYRSESSPSPASRIRPELQDVPRWQVLVDKYRNVFATGRRIVRVPGITQICWSYRSPTEHRQRHLGERLIVAAPGGVSGLSEIDEEEQVSVDGGRLVILDFGWEPACPAPRTITLEVGEMQPELLPEAQTDLETEIAIVRRRTVGRRDIPRMNAVSVAEALRPEGEEHDSIPAMPSPLGTGLDQTVGGNSIAEDTSPTSSDGVAVEEAAHALDDPYSHSSPRSRVTLYRSATAVELNRRRSPRLQIPTSGVVQYRRTDGTELPDESDADNWVPPPPPYQRDADQALPDTLRRSIASHSAPSSALGAAFRPTLQPGSAPDERPASAALARHPSSDSTITMASLHARAFVHSNRTSQVLSSSALGTDNSPPARAELASGRSTPMGLRHRGDSTSETRNAATVSPRAALRPASTPFAPLLEQVSTPETNTAIARPIPRATHSLTLSGSNLQQRLDYPLPPRPPSEPQSSPVSDAEPSAVISRDGTPVTDGPAWSLPQPVALAPTSAVETEQDSPLVDLSMPELLPALEAMNGLPETTPEPSAYQLTSMQRRRSNHVANSDVPSRSTATPGTSSSPFLASRFHIPFWRFERDTRRFGRIDLGSSRTSTHHDFAQSGSVPSPEPVAAPISTESRHDARSNVASPRSARPRRPEGGSMSTPDLLERPTARRLTSVQSVASRASSLLRPPTIRRKTAPGPVDGTDASASVSVPAVPPPVPPVPATDSETVRPRSLFSLSKRRSSLFLGVRRNLSRRYNSSAVLSSGRPELPDESVNRRRQQRRSGERPRSEFARAFRRSSPSQNEQTGSQSQGRRWQRQSLGHGWERQFPRRSEAQRPGTSSPKTQEGETADDDGGRCRVM